MTEPRKIPSTTFHSHGRDARATSKRAHRTLAMDRFQLLVECADERDQRDIYAQLTARGRKCRVITI